MIPPDTAFGDAVFNLHDLHNALFLKDLYRVNKS